MIHETTARRAIALLNDLLKTDPESVSLLIDARVPTTKAMVDHRKVPVLVENGKPMLGFLGVINAICGIDDDGHPAIAAVYDDKGKLTKFARTQKSWFK